MIRKERQHVSVSPQNILGKALQCLLWTHFDKHTGTRVIQCPQAFHELHRSSDLLRKDVYDLRSSVRADRIELAGEVRDDGYLWRAQAKPFQHLSQGFACWGHD